MQKFNVGDNVRLIENNGGGLKVGAEGLIVSVEHIRGETFRYYVNFENYDGYMVGVQHIELAAPKAKVEFDSVIIEEGKREQIVEALEQLNYLKLIFETWGFGKTMEKGKGVSMLFYGEPGTGKTLMAQAIADRLGYELKVIATAEIESSEPGQAERNIRAHFKGSGKKTVLLFDECDSLIFDRSTVGAILGAQVNELLTSLEKFEGVTIFTTNRLGTLDEAVNRRLSLKLEFSMPDAEQRKLIWQRMFPEEAPLDKDIVWEKLANVEISGGYIKNTVLRAARMAACQKDEKGNKMPDSKKTIKMAHLVKALRLEVEAMIEFKEAKKNLSKIGQPGRGVNDFGKDKGAELVKDRSTLAKIQAELDGEDDEA